MHLPDKTECEQLKAALQEIADGNHTAEVCRMIALAALASVDPEGWEVFKQDGAPTAGAIIN